MCMYLNDEDEKNCCTIVISVISFVWFSHYISYTHNSTVMCKLFQGYVCTITLLYYCSQRNDKITVFFSSNFLSRKAKKEEDLRCEKVKQQYLHKYQNYKSSSKTTNRFHIMYPVSLVQYFCRIYAKKQRRPQETKGKGFCCFSQIFSCNYSGKGKLNKGCKKNLVRPLLLCCFFFPSYLAFKVCIQEKTKKLKNGLLHAKLCCTKYSNTGLLCFLW